MRQLVVTGSDPKDALRNVLPRFDDSRTAICARHLENGSATASTNESATAQALQD